MKTTFFPSPARCQGSVMLVTVIFSVVAFMALGGVMKWVSTSAKVTNRQIQHFSAVSMAEAATEKVIASMAQDFYVGGEPNVNSKQILYPFKDPTQSDHEVFKNWEFYNANGTKNRVNVEKTAAKSYVQLDSIYKGLGAYSTKYAIHSIARNKNYAKDVIGEVRQEIQLVSIPVFQFAIFYNVDMEIGCGQPFTITGPVHANKSIWVQPISDMTFKSHISVVGELFFARHPLDNRSAPTGTVDYQDGYDTKSPFLQLPIGMSNTPEAVRQVLVEPPAGENPSSPMGSERMYNKVDLIMTVNNSGITVTSGRVNYFSTTVPANQVSLFASTSASFTDKRESKVVQAIDLNVGAVRSWSLTNAALRSIFGGRNINSIYVRDLRTLSAGNMSAVRLKNGQFIPEDGFTVATPLPLYIQGHYNQPVAAHLGTANTSGTKPAAVFCDALTILSSVWQDANSASTLSSRGAAPTTVNTAIFTGIVETKTYNSYSGGAENFPRFLESWGAANPLTYNGSMLAMFTSVYATNMWGKSDVYSPPKRDWAFDTNFKDPAKLPPFTPNFYTVIRSKWDTVVSAARQSIN